MISSRRSAAGGVAYEKKNNKLSGSMAIDRNCAEASVRGNWRKENGGYR